MISGIIESHAVLGGPPAEIRSLAEEHFGRANAASYLAAMNRSQRSVVSLHGIAQMVLYQHADDVMVQRLETYYISQRAEATCCLAAVARLFRARERGTLLLGWLCKSVRVSLRTGAVFYFT